jgi:hypothetical protein
MGKLCYYEQEFQERVRQTIACIRDIQEDMEENKLRLMKYKKELKTNALKGDCDKCKHRMECITNEREEIKYGRAK